MSCSNCANKNWNCPYPYCSMSSSRHWNVTRHIQRRHSGSGVPENRFIHKVFRDPSIQKGFGSYAGVAVAEAIAASSKLSSQKQKKKFDPFDYVLPSLRKAAEFKNLLKQFSPQAQGTPIFGSSPYGSLYNAGSAPFGVFNNNLDSLSYSFNNGAEIVGYHGYSCLVCLINDPLPIYNRERTKGLSSGQQETQAILPGHQCKSQRVVECSLLPQNTKQEIIINLGESLPYKVLNAVNSWTNNCARLISHEIPSNVNIDLIDLFPKNEDHWSTRSIKKRGTPFNSVEELKEFIVSAGNRTLGLFRIHSRSQDKEIKVPYLIAISPTGSFPS